MEFVREGRCADRGDARYDSDPGVSRVHALREDAEGEQGNFLHAGAQGDEGPSFRRYSANFFSAKAFSALLKTGFPSSSKNGLASKR